MAIYTDNQGDHTVLPFRQFSEENKGVEVIEYRMKECGEQFDEYSPPESWPLIFPK